MSEEGYKPTEEETKKEEDGNTNQEIKTEEISLNRFGERVMSEDYIKKTLENSGYNMEQVQKTINEIAQNDGIGIPEASSEFIVLLKRTQHEASGAVEEIAWSWYGQQLDGLDMLKYTHKLHTYFGQPLEDIYKLILRSIATHPRYPEDETMDRNVKFVLDTLNSCLDFSKDEHKEWAQTVIDGLQDKWEKEKDHINKGQFFV